MPFFARRRLQRMLDELAEHLSGEKATDLVRRLEDKRVEQALPAELELALLWATSRLGNVVVEPESWSDTRRPDAYTDALLPDRPAAIEMAAPNDNDLSGEGPMDRIARVVAECADGVRKGTGNRLYFRFEEESGYDSGTYYRRRLAPTSYSLSKKVRSLILEWIVTGACERQRLRIVDEGLNVEVELTDQQQTRFFNTWSTMPPETHSLEDNHLYQLLARKTKQLRGAPQGTARYIFLADAGSTLLRHIGTAGETDPTRRRVSGREILSHFIEKHSSRVDSIVVFAPRRQHAIWGMGALRWAVSVFNRPGLDHDQSGLEALAAELPIPRYEGYQARSLFRQGCFAPAARGQYLGTMVTTGPDGTTIRIPARALLDLLAGRITREDFLNFIDQRESNLFQLWLDRGMTFSGAELEPGGVDEDDDLLVLRFEDDPAARALQTPESPPTTQRMTRSERRSDRVAR